MKANILNKVRVGLAYELLKNLIQTQTPFRIVLWTENNWDKPLPEDVLKKFPNQLVLDIDNDSLKDSYIDKDIVISTWFNGEQYTKVVKDYEIAGILELNGTPMIVNNFRTLNTGSNLKEGKIDLEKICDIIQKEIPESQYNGIINSLNAFQRNNKDLFE